MRTAFFLVVTAFFITMNVLLWRSEFGTNHQFGAALPADGVWEKVLTAPDNSFLSIRHHGKKIGTCHWAPSIGQERSNRLMSEEASPEGMIEAPSSYTIDINGNVVVEESKVRFSVDVGLATNQTWRTLLVHLSLRPTVFEVQASAVDETIHVRMDDGQEHTDKTFKFSDLRQPDKLLKELGGPFLPAALTSLGLTPSLAAPSPQKNASLGLQWKARYDRLKVGGDTMRVIRLTAHLLDRFQVLILVSPVGEILRIELPGEIVLINDALANLAPVEDDRTPTRR